MQLISCHNGQLQTLKTAGLKATSDRAFATGLDALDALAPQQSFARGAVHELLFDADAGTPTFVAATIAQCLLLPLPSRERVGVRVRREESDPRGHADRPTPFGVASPSDSLRLTPHPNPLPSGERGPDTMPLIWSDPHRELYPPALAALGFDLTKVYLLHTDSPPDESWAVAECLRCRGVGTVIAAPRRLSRIEARRLQLAAERGGSVGLLLRQTGRGDSIYAAATRWKISPARGERTVQRWKIQLLHGHGGRVGESVFLEWRREDHSVRAVEKLADRPPATEAADRRIA